MVMRVCDIETTPLVVQSFNCRDIQSPQSTQLISKSPVMHHPTRHPLLSIHDKTAYI